MTILLKGWRIKSHNLGGYITQKKVGKQWKETHYFRTLSQAACDLLEQRIHDESTDIVIDSTNTASMAIAKNELCNRLDSIRDEIVRVLK